MTFPEAKQNFIKAWGALGPSWGINKTMAQIHALLLISTKPLSTEEIMKMLHISRGNANMNIRSLLDWGIIQKDLVMGERKEYFVAGKDMWELARRVSMERRKRELEPVLHLLDEIQKIEGSNTQEVREFKRVTKEMKRFAEKIDSMLQLCLDIDLSRILKILKRRGKDKVKA